MERRAKAATTTGLYLVVIAAILVIGNAISYKTFARFDTTPEDRFTLSLGSKRIVCEKLTQDLNVDVYVTRGLAKTDLFIQDLTDLLKEYESASYKRADGSKSPPSKFHFTIVEPKTEAEKEAAKKEGLTEQLLDERSETSDQATLTTGFMGFVLKYGNEKEVIGFWPPDSTQGLEFFLSNKIMELRSRADKIETKFGLITGHDELKITDNVLAPGGQPFNLKQIFDEYFPFYKFEDVDLQNGDAEIDKELVGIIITQPQKDFTEKELRRIDEFLMTGNKAAAFFVSAVNLKANDKDMKASLNTHGLEKLLDGYGIEMKREAALDFGSAFRQAALTQLGQQVWLLNPGVAVLTADDDLEENERLFDPAFPTFFRMREVALPFPSPLVPHPDKQPKATIKVVARTSPRTSVDASDNIIMRHSNEWRETAPQEQRIVGLTVGCPEKDEKQDCANGSLASAFAGKGDNMGIAAPAETPPGSPSRVLVISSSQFLANPFARSGNPPPMPPQLQMMGGQQGDRELMVFAQEYQRGLFRPMIFGFKGTLDFLSNDPDLLAVNAKLQSEPSLKYSSKKPKAEANDTEESMKKKLEAFKQERSDLQSKVQWTLILLPALLVLLFGIVRWRMREASRDKMAL